MPQTSKANAWRCENYFALSMFCILIGLLTGGTLHAQDQDDSAVQAQNEHLRKVAALQKQLADETNAFNEAWNNQAAKVNRLLGKRQTLTEKKLQAEIALHKLQRDNQGYSGRLSQKQAQSLILKQAVNDIYAAAENLDEKIDLHMAEVPGHDGPGGRREARESPPAASPGLRHTPPRMIADYTRQVFARAEMTRGEASRIRLNSCAIYTAGGMREKVTLLSVGHIAGAYVTHGGDRIGYALTSPSDASGYRWYEGLTEANQQRILTAVRKVSDAGDIRNPLRIEIPFDITGNLQADMLEADTGLMAKIHDGGPVVIPLAFVALLALCVTLERYVVLYLFNPCGKGVDKTVEACLDQHDYDTCESVLDTSRGVVPRVLLACLRERRRGVQAMEDAIQAQLLRELPILRRFLGGLAILATIAPLLGLLGTVTGIIQTFEVLKTFGNADPHHLAGGISEALITTASGLVIAIPILLVRGMLRGRTEKIIARAESRAAGVLIQVVTNQEANRASLD